MTRATYRVIQILGTGALAAGLSHGQNFWNPLTTAGVEQTGVRLNSASVFAAYTAANSSGTQSLVDGFNQGGSTYSRAGGASAVFSLRTGSDRSNVTVLYTPSFLYQRYTISQRAVSHNLAVGSSLALGPKWTLSMTGSAALGSFNQLLFSGVNGQDLLALQGSFEDVAGAVLAGKSSNPAIAAAAGSASATIAPQQQAVFGNRFLTATANAGLSYAASTRLTVSFTLSGNRTQHLSDGEPAGQRPIIPQATVGSAYGSINYMLSPRTSVTGSINYSRSFSAQDRSQYESFQFGIGRKLSQRWFASVAAGAGYFNSAQYLGGGSQLHSQESGTLGYRAGSHSLMGTVAKSISSYYGITAGSRLDITGMWMWAPRRTNWAFHAGGTQDRLLGNTLPSSGSRFFVGLIRPLSRTTFLSLQYTHALFSGELPDQAGTVGRFEYQQHAARLNFTWGQNGGMWGGSGGAGGRGRSEGDATP